MRRLSIRALDKSLFHSPSSTVPTFSSSFTAHLSVHQPFLRRERSKQTAAQRWMMYKHKCVMHCISCERQKPFLGMNVSELLNIQKRDSPPLGPSHKNSWPNPLPHLPQQTWNVQIHKVPIKMPFVVRLLTGAAVEEIPSGIYNINPAVLLPLWVPRLQGVWTYCLHGLSLRRLAKEKSAQTLTCWKITHGHIQNTHIHLRGQGLSESVQLKCHGLLVYTLVYYSPGSKWFLYSSPPEKKQYDMSSISSVFVS